MPKPGVYRSPWHDFPDVVIQTTVHKLRSRPAYDEAKRGVGEAAFEVVQELIKPEKITFAFDIIVPVMQFDRDKPNALPLVYATALAKHFDAYLEIGVRQANVVSHTFADALRASWASQYSSERSSPAAGPSSLTMLLLMARL
jgi:hypothetical protein